MTFVKTQTASTIASHDGQGSSSRGKPNGYHHPSPVQESTEHVTYPFHSALFLPEYGMPMGCGRVVHASGSASTHSLVPQHEEVRDIRRMKVSELRRLVEETPEQIFTLHLGILAYYLQHNRSHP